MAKIIQLAEFREKIEKKPDLAELLSLDNQRVRMRIGNIFDQPQNDTFEVTPEDVQQAFEAEAIAKPTFMHAKRCLLNKGD